MSVMNNSNEPGLEDTAAGSSRKLRRALVSDALTVEVIAQTWRSRCCRSW